MTPPRLSKAVLRSLLPRDERDHVAHELDLLYGHRASRFGRRQANRWYRREVLHFVTVAGVGRFRGRRRRRSSDASNGLMFDFWRDVKRAARSLYQNPRFTAGATLTLTLGIGANTLIVSVVDHVAFRSLPYPEPERLVSIWPDHAMLRGEIDIIQRESRTLSTVAGFLRIDGLNLETVDGSLRVEANLVSPELLDVLGAPPIIGRNFLPHEANPESDAVVHLSHDFWREQFGADGGIIGRQIVLDGVSRTVVGILPADFAFPDADQDVLIPLTMDPSSAGVFWGYGGHRAVARLAPHATPEMAREELSLLAEQMRMANPLWTPNQDFRAQATVVPLRDALVGDVQPTLMILLGAVGLVLLVACANVANLLLARGLDRSREVALRAALGATRGRLLREHLLESLCLAAIGSLVALVAAYWGLQALVALLPAEIPRAEEITLDARIVAVGVAVALFAGLVAGAVPALRGSQTEPHAVLREASRGSSGRSRARRRLSSALVIAQMAVAVVLVVGAGLLLRSLSALHQVDTGFDSANVTTARLTLAGDAYDLPADRHRFFEDVRQRMQSIPGVLSVGIGSRVPFGRGFGGIATFIENVTADPNNLPIFQRTQVTPGYLETLGIPLIEGRSVRATDGADSPLIAVVDQTAAREFWPGESPIGRRIRYPWRGAPWIEVIGVVGGISDGDLSSERAPRFYVPMSQSPPGTANLVVRTERGAPVAATIRRVVREVDRTVPVSGLTTLDRLIGESLARTRWTTTLLALFAAMTLLLGCVGVYGVVAYSVRARTQEIGVRMALGADRRRIRARVLFDGLRLAVPGTIIGLGAAIPGARVLDGLLFGVSTLDSVTFAAVPALLLGAAITAVYVPARRATSIDPVEALRAEA